MVTDFLALEGLRLGARLRVAWDWDASLEHLEPRTRLVPVFDLEDPRWDVLLP